MKVKLIRDARISHKAGEIVEVSPSEFHYLTSLGSAVAISEKAAEVKTEKTTSTKRSKTTK